MSNAIPYGAKISDAMVKPHININDRYFDFIGIFPVSRNSRVCRPKNLFLVTKEYSRSDERTKKVAEIMSQMVPGNPGRKYPIIPSAKNINPSPIKSQRLSRTKIINEPFSSHQNANLFTRPLQFNGPCPENQDSMFH